MRDELLSESWSIEITKPLWFKNHQCTKQQCVKITKACSCSNGKGSPLRKCSVTYLFRLISSCWLTDWATKGDLHWKWNLDATLRHLIRHFSMEISPNTSFNSSFLTNGSQTLPQRFSQFAASVSVVFLLCFPSINSCMAKKRFQGIEMLWVWNFFSTTVPWPRNINFKDFVQNCHVNQLSESRFFSFLWNRHLSLERTQTDQTESSFVFLLLKFRTSQT